MNPIFHKAGSRSCADLGWLISRHSFSFAGGFDSAGNLIDDKQQQLVEVQLKALQAWTQKLRG